MEHWISRAIHGSTTSSTTSSSSTQSGGSGAARLSDLTAPTHIGPIAHLSLKRKSKTGTVENGNSLRRSCEFGSELTWQPLETEENHCAPPDVTTYTSEHSIQVERPQGSTSRSVPKYGNAELMETGDGVPVSSRVSAKIQQLVNTLKRPKRPPLREFFVDDFEELLEGRGQQPRKSRLSVMTMTRRGGEEGVLDFPLLLQPDPNQPKPEGAQMLPMRGEQLGVVTNWPPSLEAALQRWGTISPKAPCLTTMDTNGKPLYILTYGKLWTRSMKVAYNILHKLGSKQEPMVRPGDRVALVFPNNDPAAFMVAFYGCLLAEIVPVPIEVPLTRKVALVFPNNDPAAFMVAFYGCLLAEIVPVPIEVLFQCPLKCHLRERGKKSAELGVFRQSHTVQGVADGMCYKCVSSPTVCEVYVYVAQIIYTARAGILQQVDAGSQQIGFLLGSCGVTVALTSDACHKGLPKSPTGEIPQFKGNTKKPPYKELPIIQAILCNSLGQRAQRPKTHTRVLTRGAAPREEVGPGRIAVFSISVLHDERVVIVAEQRPDSTEEDSFQWMSRVLQAIDSIHQVGVYCLALVPANTLPKTPLGGIHLSETKQLFLEGSLHPCNVLMCPHTCVTNLPKPRQKQPEIGPASVMVGNLVSGKRIAQASGRDLGQIEDNDQARKVCVCVCVCVTQGLNQGLDFQNFQTNFLFLSEVLQWRAQTTPDHTLYTLLSSRGTIASSLTCLQLHKRAEKIAAMLGERGHLQDGDHVALVYPPGIDLIAAFYGCLYAGCVPITVRPPHPQNIATTLPTVKMIVEVSRSACIMTSQVICKLLRSKEASAAVDVRTWPPVLETDDLPKKRPPQVYKPSDPDTLAYLDFSVSTTGMLAGVKMSHTATSAFCRSIKLQCELYPSREVAICLDPYCGLGFVLWCLCSVYSGHQSILIPPSELEINPALWLLAVSQYKVRDTFCSYSVMELCTKGLGLQTELLKSRGLDLSRVRTCVVVAEERPRISLTQSFSKLFKDLGLHPRAVSTSFGCRVNLAICLQGTSGPDPTTVFVDMRALRHDRILPGVRIIIANPETKGPLGDSHLGEVWVHSAHNSSGYFTIYGEESLQSDHFNSHLSFGDTQTIWARTGYLGFLRRTDLTDASGGEDQAVFFSHTAPKTLS
ncbi:UNVERIFIED_CONTAM: hypothetical protein FKN15_066560 [Acipenser sinensis]